MRGGVPLDEGPTHRRHGEVDNRSHSHSDVFLDYGRSLRNHREPTQTLEEHRVYTGRPLAPGPTIPLFIPFLVFNRHFLCNCDCRNHWVLKLPAFSECTHAKTSLNYFICDEETKKKRCHDTVSGKEKNPNN